MYVHYKMLCYVMLSDRFIHTPSISIQISYEKRKHIYKFYVWITVYMWTVHYISSNEINRSLKSSFSPLRPRNISIFIAIMTIYMYIYNHYIDILVLRRDHNKYMHHNTNLHVLSQCICSTGYNDYQLSAFPIAVFFFQASAFDNSCGIYNTDCDMSFGII